jgi:predicted kinase
VRAKVDCVRYTQGHHESADDARRHLQIALDHLRAASVRLILVGGGAGTGKTTLARAVAEHLDAQVISTDDVRAEMVADGRIAGEPGVLGEGLYSRENIAAVYRAVLAKAQLGLSQGRTVILDGTWSDPDYRQQAHRVAADAAAAVVEFACAAPLEATVARIRTRANSASQVTASIATALARSYDQGIWSGAHRIDTTRELATSVAEVMDILRQPVERRRGEH